MMWKYVALFVYEQVNEEDGIVKTGFYMKIKSRVEIKT